MLLSAALSASLTLPTLPAPPPASFAAPEAIAAPSIEALLLGAPARLSFVDEEVSGDSPLSYTYVEIGATEYSIDDIGGSDEDVDTYYARASLALGFLYVFGGYETQDLDFEDTDSDLWRLGVGAHLGLMRNLDLLGEVAWLYNDVSSDLSQLDESDSGYEIRGGARWLAMEWSRGGLELDGNLLYVNLDNRLGSEEDDVGVELGARLHFLEFLSVGGMYTMFEDDDQLGLNLRASF
jgi:hypothetical protein